MKTTNKSDHEIALSRRKALARIGLFAAAAYAVPAFTTLSVAQAASNPSAASEPSEPSAPSEPSEPSAASEPSVPSVASSPSLPSTAEECEAVGGTWNPDTGTCEIVPA